MSRKKRTQLDSAVISTVATYDQYVRRLSELTMSMFEWIGLPDSIDKRFLEWVLMMNGQALFFYDEELGEFLAMQNTSQGSFDYYNNPTKRRAYAVNGYNRELDDTNSVLIWNNEIRTNTILDIQMYSQRLTNIEKAIDININGQKTPLIIVCKENERFSLNQLYEQYEGNTPIIFAKKNFDELLSCIRTDVPYLADRLHSIKTEIWNEALTHLGISNVNIMKKERMITDEVKRNTGGIIASRYGRLNARQKACEEINKKYGLNVWCEFKSDNVIETIDEEVVADE